MEEDDVKKIEEQFKEELDAMGPGADAPADAVDELREEETEG